MKTVNQIEQTQTALRFILFEQYLTLWSFRFGEAKLRRRLNRRYRWNEWLRQQPRSYLRNGKVRIEVRNEHWVRLWILGFEESPIEIGEEGFRFGAMLSFCFCVLVWIRRNSRKSWVPFIVEDGGTVRAR